MGRRSMSYGHVGRAMLTHDEMMELPAHLQVIRMKGLKPILATKIDYRTDDACAGKALSSHITGTFRQETTGGHSMRTHRPLFIYRSGILPPVFWYYLQASGESCTLRGLQA